MECWPGWQQKHLYKTGLATTTWVAPQSLRTYKKTSLTTIHDGLCFQTSLTYRVQAGTRGPLLPHPPFPNQVPYQLSHLQGLHRLGLLLPHLLTPNQVPYLLFPNLVPLGAGVPLNTGATSNIMPW